MRPAFSLCCMRERNMLCRAVMDTHAHQRLMLVATSFLLVACGATTAKKSDVWDLYDMHNSKIIQSGAVPIDNDSYYRQPGSYNCNTIADLPSCPDD